ncbi:MAG: cysteine synthase [Desulfobacteraceae bacterium]|jgi:cysteinyl-tRNA synthetase|nr:cysteine synthase [Desulfobacteraceae bacterium]
MASSILDYIGNTPLVPIRRLNPNPRVRLLAKVEYLNPGGSIKDRTALAMIEAGEASGQLVPGRTVIEATSGNTGIGLALVCAVKGYPLVLAMSEAVSLERRKILEARGAEILLTPGHLGTDGAIEEVYRLVREHPERYYMADQYNSPANWQAHYRTTAPEIWDQTGGEVTHVVATLGTSGTLMGISRRLKEYRPDIQIIGVEPYLGHKIQGLKNMKEAYRPEIFEKQRLDEKINIDDEDAFEMARRLAREEGLMVGMSSGAAMAVAINLARRLETGTVVAILPDSGERYLSTSLFTRRITVGLQLFNTLTREKETFVPREAGKASIYTCGPTADARPHLGEYRRFVLADLLCRYLSYRGLEVRQVMNITDYDDKTIAGSETAGQPLEAFTEAHIQAFLEDLERLGVRPAAVLPRASAHIDQMIALAERLARKGYAYEKLRSLYFDISRFDGYGRLSGIDLDKIRLGTTVDLDEYEKDNPRDFTLLKRARLSELKRGIFVKTEWGNVRPSWHLQCAAMAHTYLGESYDIHTSGRELIFPHHENIIAIAGALTGRPPARFWLHSDPVMVDGKQAEARDGAMTLADLDQRGYTGREIRFWLLGTHYRKPLVLSDKALKDARRALRRLDAVVGSLHRTAVAGQPCPDVDQICYDLKTGFTDAMDDDLSISRAMAALFRTVKRINALIQEGRLDQDGAGRILETLGQIDTVLNVFDFHQVEADPAVMRLMAEREAARAARDWARADRLREELRQRGVTVRDGRTPRANP